MIKREKGLGKGLGALFSNPEIDKEMAGQSITEVDIDQIVPQKRQPRRHFNEESLRELSESIREHGVLQPILLREKGSGYELIAGERRWRAARMAGLATIPSVVKEIDDNRAAEIALVENLQRDDLSVVEEAMAYKNLIEQHKYTHDILADKLGKSRVHITNTMRLLGLTPEVLAMLESSQITAGHARALLAIEDARQQIAIAEEIANLKLSVRATERKVKSKKKAGSKRAVKKQAEIVELEERLQNHFGCKVQIAAGSQGGRIEINYFNDDELDRILEMLGI